MDDYKDKNDDKNGHIYYNGDFYNHDYSFKYRSLSGTGRWEGEYLTLDGGSGKQISNGGECGTHDDGGDDNNIDKNYGFLPGRPYSATTGTSLGQLVDNRHPDILA